ncbi:transcriptional regulatory protein [Paramyrothecium foliicola]|nr:transcriptional regulatory protein [Paramyrothecium foliicola]
MKDHVKSRHGCVRCKQRKVKCDETLPSCRRCNQRREVCSYLAEYGNVDALRFAQVAPPSPAQGASHEGSPSRSVPHQLDPDSYKEDMALVHQFLTSTYKTLWTHPTGQLVWRDNIFHTALGDATLFNGILATAAMHKIVIADSPSASLEEIALRKQTTALEGFRTMLHSVKAEQYAVAYPMSLLVSFWAFASRKLPNNLNILRTEVGLHAMVSTGSDISATGALDDFLQLLGIIQPTKVVFAQFRESLLQGVFAAMAAVPPIEQFPELTEPEARALGELDRNIEDIAVSSSMASAKHTFPMQYLYRLTKQPDWLHLIVAWPIQLSEAFIEKARSREPAALTVLAYWIGCFHSLDDKWWAAGWSKELLQEIKGIVRDEWLEFVKWPCERVGL